MNKQRMLSGMVIVAVLLALAGGFSQAQGPQPPEGEVGTEGEDRVAEPVGSRIPIQGRLTDTSGNPLNGSYSITFKLYDREDATSAVCWTTKTVTVTNGLFSDSMSCASGIIDGRQLWLGIKVGTDAEMRPRQAIYPVPYAWSLIPGTSIEGSTVSSAILEVRNDGSGPALYATGNGIIKSTAATDWVVSPLKMVQEDSVNSNDLNIVPSTQHGYVKLYTDGQDDCLALLPVDVPALLFGTRVKLSSFYFCYRMDNPADKIDQVDVEYVGNDGAAHNLCSYTTDVFSTTWACQTCNLASPASIWGPVFVRFTLHFAGDGSGRGIRLGQMYLHLTE